MSFSLFCTLVKKSKNTFIFIDGLKTLLAFFKIYCLQMIRPLRINYIATFSTEPILVIQLFFIHPILLFYLSKKILVIEPFSGGRNWGAGLHLFGIYLVKIQKNSEFLRILSFLFSRAPHKKFASAHPDPFNMILSIRQQCGRLSQL